MGRPNRAITLVHLGDVTGGAGRAARRLYRGLQSIDSNVRFAVSAAAASEIEASLALGSRRAWWWRVREQIDRLPTRFLPREERYGLTRLALPGGAARSLLSLSASLVHIHFLGHGSVRLESLLRLACPVVWTLHDQWLMSGGGHHYANPFATERGVYRRHLARKCRVIAALRPTVIAPSRWIGREASTSQALGGCRIEVIPNGIDTERWRPTEKMTCRRELGLPLNLKIVAVGALGLTDQRRKGWGSFCQAMARLVQCVDPGLLAIVVFGSGQVPGLGSIPSRVFNLGRIDSHEQLRRVYGAADVFVCPSLQENLPNMVMEAAACGVPVAAFDTGGLPDLVEHQVTGVLAQCGDAQSLADGVAWILGHEDRRRTLGQRARMKVSRSFGIDHVVRRHMALYDELIGSDVHGGHRADRPGEAETDGRGEQSYCAGHTVYHS